MSARTLHIDDSVQNWMIDNILREDEVLLELRRATADLPMARMQISPEQGRFLTWLAHTLGARRIVEVGTFTGYSALCLARALPADGELVCCDVSDEWTRIARRHWERAGLADRIQLHLGPASDTLDARLAAGEAGTYDLAFIDADKQGYAGYVEQCAALLRPGGVIAIDNTLWSGRVADPAEVDPSTVAIREVVLSVTHDPRFEASLVPIGDGLLLATKR